MSELGFDQLCLKIAYYSILLCLEFCLLFQYAPAKQSLLCSHYALENGEIHENTKLIIQHRIFNCTES